MNIGLKFRDKFFGALGQTVREELDQLVASIAQHWLVGHNVDGSHSNAIGSDAGDPTGSRFLRDDMVWVDLSYADTEMGETISGAWTFSTLPVLGTLTGYIKGTAGALSAATTVPVADVAISGTPDGTKFLRDDGTWAAPPGAAGGETNTASNYGVGGVGVYDSKSGVDLRFRNIIAKSAKVAVTLDNTDHEVEIDLGSVAIDDLSDVTITAGAAGDYLRHNGSAWVDATIQDADLGSGTPDNTKFLRGDRTWAVPPGSPSHDWMYPPGPSAMANASLADAVCYAVCVGRLPASATSVKVRFYVATAMAGVVTYAEVAIGKSAQPDGIPQITPVGYTDVSAVINGNGAKAVTVNVAGGQSLAAGDYLWILIAQNAASTNPQMSGYANADHHQVGYHGTKNTFQPSTGIGSAQTFTITAFSTTNPSFAALPS